MPSRRFLFVSASSRNGGNTETLARLAASELPSTAEQHWLILRDLNLPPFRDQIRKPDPPQEPAGTELMLLDETMRATDLVLVSPLYWYSLSWSMKLYLDYWATWERLPGRDFPARMRGKTLWVICVMADQDKKVADPLLKSLELSAAYLDARFAGALLGTGSWPGDVLADHDAVEQARTYFGSVPDPSLS